MKTLQIRNVPDDLHRQPRARAAQAGTSLSALALAELARSVERPTRQELIERVAADESRVADESAAEAVRAEREVRD